MPDRCIGRDGTKQARSNMPIFYKTGPAPAL
jgi:hypothetical protein